jgi:lysophospholipase L1-like esterase
MKSSGFNRGWRLVSTTLLKVLLFFFLLESILSILYYQKYGNDSLATIQWLRKIKKVVIGEENGSFNIHNQTLARPGGSPATNEGVASETRESNHFLYEPWVQFRVADFNGNYVNIQGLERKSSPNIIATGPRKDTLLIYFFGGSTMFGFNVADQETIPSQFIKLLSSKFPASGPVKVVNFGIPFYYSYQELILFSQMLFQGQKPAAAVFMDGLNDFLYVGATYPRQPYFSYILRQVFNEKYLETEHFHFRDSSQLLTQDPPGDVRRLFYPEMVNRYFQNLDNIRRLGSQYGVKTFFFCHPVPFYRYPNQSKDPICDKDQNSRFEAIYPLVEKRGSIYSDFYFLGNMLENEKGVPFIDGFHFSPAMNQRLADEMLNRMENWIRSSP